MTAEKVLQLESDYLFGMEVNLEQAEGKLLRGSRWQLVSQDESDRLRALMARHKKFDRQTLSETPKNRRAVLHGYKRPWWWFGKKRVGVAVASCLSPMEWYVLEGQSGKSAPPVGSRELLDHVRSLVVDPHVPHVIGVCSPTGFTLEARAIQPQQSNVTLVLVEPGATGGWRVVGGSDGIDPRIRELFDPEDLHEKTERVTSYLEQNSALLLTGELAASAVARQLELPESVVEKGFSLVANQEPELHLSQVDGEMLLFRGASAEKQERFSMSMVDRIRQLFSREGDETQKINELSERRAALSQRRNRMYDDIAQLEKRESDLVEQGRQNKSQVARRRIAAQVAQLRKDLARHNATTNMLNKQINILSTDIHNLTMIQQGEVARLPSTEQLTENAVKAEEMLETLKADADLVGSLETGITDMLTSEEEVAIMKEFEEVEEPAAPQPEQQSRVAQAPEKTPAAEQRRDDRESDGGEKAQEPEPS